MIFEFFVSIWSDPITTYVAGGSDPNVVNLAST